MTSFLFGGKFEYESKTELNEFLESMGPESALQLIETALDHALRKGAFGMVESNCIYKCLEKLKENENKEGNIRNIHNNGDTN